jgi:hypothetical protein
LDSNFKQAKFKRSQHVGSTSSNIADATCWRRLNTMLGNVGLSLSLLSIFTQHRATLLVPSIFRLNQCAPESMGKKFSASM